MDNNWESFVNEVKGIVNDTEVTINYCRKNDYNASNNHKKIMLNYKWYEFIENESSLTWSITQCNQISSSSIKKAELQCLALWLTVGHEMSHLKNKDKPYFCLDTIFMTDAHFVGEMRELRADFEGAKIVKLSKEQAVKALEFKSSVNKSAIYSYLFSNHPGWEIRKMAIKLLEDCDANTLYDFVVGTKKYLKHLKCKNKIIKKYNQRKW